MPLLHVNKNKIKSISTKTESISSRQVQLFLLPLFTQCSITVTLFIKFLHYCT